MPRVTAEMRARIVSAYRAGIPGPTIAEEVGVSPGTLYKVIADAGLSKGKGHKEPTVDDQAIADAYKECLSAYEVARRLGIGATTVYHSLARSGIGAKGLQHYRENAEKYPRETQLEILRLYESGIRVPELMERFGGSFSSVKQAILRNGGSMKPPGGKERIRLAPEREQEICDMYRNGMSQDAIAEVVGNCQAVISRVLRANGIGARVPRVSHHKFGGGRMRHGSGYDMVFVPADDPMGCMRNRTGYVLEHRIVMARTLGRPLLKTETVHHINGNRLDNRPENLQLRQGRHGHGVVMCCLDCGSRRLGPVPIED